MLFREGFLSYFPLEAWILSVESCAGGVFSGAALVGFMRWCRSPFCFPCLDFVCFVLVLPAVLVVSGFLLLFVRLVLSLLPCKSLIGRGEIVLRRLVFLGKLAASAEVPMNLLYAIWQSDTD